MPRPTLTLEDSDLWNQFHKQQNEMIITKSGRCLFPALGLRAAGLIPTAKYSVHLDLEQLAPTRFKYCEGNWESVRTSAFFSNSKFDSYRESHTHPDGVRSGSHWMKSPIYFDIKLSNEVFALEETSKNTPKENPKETPEETSEKTLETAPEETFEDSPEKVPERTPETVPKEAFEGSPDKMPEKTPETVLEETLEDSSEKMPKKAPETVHKEALEGSPEKMPEKVFEKTPEKILERMSEKAPEEKSEVAPKEFNIKSLKDSLMKSTVKSAGNSPERKSKRNLGSTEPSASSDKGTTDTPNSISRTITMVETGIFHVKSFHKYRPRIIFRQHSDSSSGALKENTFKFDATTFIAVTHYQNDKVNDLKKLHNPHAWGERGKNKTRKILQPIEEPMDHGHNIKNNPTKKRPLSEQSSSRVGKRTRQSQSEEETSHSPAYRGIRSQGNKNGDEISHFTRRVQQNQAEEETSRSPAYRGMRSQGSQNSENETFQIPSYLNRRVQHNQTEKNTSRSPAYRGMQPQGSQNSENESSQILPYFNKRARHNHSEEETPQSPVYHSIRHHESQNGDEEFSEIPSYFNKRARHNQIDEETSQSPDYRSMGHHRNQNSESGTSQNSSYSSRRVQQNQSTRELDLLQSIDQTEDNLSQNISRKHNLTEAPPPHPPKRVRWSQRLEEYIDDKATEEVMDDTRNTHATRSCTKTRSSPSKLPLVPKLKKTTTRRFDLDDDTPTTTNPNENDGYKGKSPIMATYSTYSEPPRLPLVPKLRKITTRRFDLDDDTPTTTNPNENDGYKGKSPIMATYSTYSEPPRLPLVPKLRKITTRRFDLDDDTPTTTNPNENENDGHKGKSPIVAMPSTYSEPPRLPLIPKLRKTTTRRFDLDDDTPTTTNPNENDGYKRKSPIMAMPSTYSEPPRLPLVPKLRKTTTRRFDLDDDTPTTTNPNENENDGHKGKSPIMATSSTYSELPRLPLIPKLKKTTTRRFDLDDDTPTTTNPNENENDGYNGKLPIMATPSYHSELFSRDQHDILQMQNNSERRYESIQSQLYQDSHTQHYSTERFSPLSQQLLSSNQQSSVSTHGVPTSNKQSSTLNQQISINGHHISTLNQAISTEAVADTDLIEQTMPSPSMTWYQRFYHNIQDPIEASQEITPTVTTPITSDDEGVALLLDFQQLAAEKTMSSDLQHKFLP
ncbi:hypothetical protein FBU30_006374 [Linnemannia zychae]|nr:hypothetical protein FBU30_006374 [Linnemannia zychae]